MPHGPGVHQPQHQQGTHAPGHPQIPPQPPVPPHQQQQLSSVNQQQQQANPNQPSKYTKKMFYHLHKNVTGANSRSDYRRYYKLTVPLQCMIFSL